jgi:hypothetical protein
LRGDGIDRAAHVDELTGILRRAIEATMADLRRDGLLAA